MLWFSRKKFRLPRTFADILRHFQSGQRYAHEGVGTERVSTLTPVPSPVMQINPLLVGILGTVLPLGVMLLALMTHQFEESGWVTPMMFTVAGILLLGFWGWPWLVLIQRYWQSRCHDVWLDWFSFSVMRRGAAILAAGYVLTLLFYWLLPGLDWMHDWGAGLLVIFLGGCALTWMGLVLLKLKAIESNLIASRTLLDIPFCEAVSVPVLYLGQSTGTLTEKMHLPALAPGQAVGLSVSDVSQNVIILGDSDNARTSVMQPLLFQVMQWGWGGLIFDTKGDFYRSVEAMAGAFGRSVTTLSVEECECNVLAGLTPDVAARILTSAFRLAQLKSDGGDWLVPATELCRHSLGVLAILPGRYTLKGLYDFLSNASVREKQREAAAFLLPTLPKDEQVALQQHLDAGQEIWVGLAKKKRPNVLSACVDLLSPFAQPELEAAFCAPEGVGLNWSGTLQGQVFLLQLPLSRWGMAGKIICTFWKLTFFTLMQQRSQHEWWSQDNPVMLMAEDYQEIISAGTAGVSDANFWATSGQSKTLGIISVPSVKHMNTVVGNRDVTHTFLQNFRQTLCLRMEDTATLSYLERTMEQTKEIPESDRPAHIDVDNEQQEEATSHSRPADVQQRVVIDQALMCQLKPRQMLAMLSINGRRVNDILVTQPLFVEQTEIIWPR